MSDETAGFNPVKSTERTLAVLEHLADAGGKQTLSELSRALGIPKSSLHAILRTMQARGWIHGDQAGGTFAIGLRATIVGGRWIDADAVVTAASGPLDDLVASIDETVHLGRLDGHDIVYLAKRECSHPLRMFSAIGRRLPAYSTALGKALLAAQPSGRLAAHLPEQLAALTGHTITDRDALTAELTVTHGRGYAVDAEENSAGIRCLAVAVPTTAPPEDAVSCSIPTSRFDEAATGDIIARLHEAAQRIAILVGPS